MSNELKVLDAWIAARKTGTRRSFRVEVTTDPNQLAGVAHYKAIAVVASGTGPVVYKEGNAKVSIREAFLSLERAMLSEAALMLGAEGKEVDEETNIS